MNVTNAPYYALSLKNRGPEKEHLGRAQLERFFLTKTGPYLELVDVSHHLNALLVVMSVRP